MWRLDTDATGETLEDADVVVSRRYYQPRLIPNAIEPRGRARACPAPTGDVTLYSATQVPHILRAAHRGDARDDRDEAAGRRARRRRRLRLEARRLRGGVPRGRARAPARRARCKWIGGALGELRRDDPRPRRRHRVHRSRATKDGTITALPGARRRRRWARISSSSRPGSRFSAPGSTPGRTRSRTTASSSRASSRTRRRPTRTAAPGVPRRRT